MSRVAITATAFALAHDCDDCDATHVTLVETAHAPTSLPGLGLVPKKLLAELAAIVALRDDGWEVSVHGAVIRCPTHFRSAA